MQKGAANSRPQIFVGSHKKMLQNISESLRHLQVNQSSDSSGSGAQPPLPQNGNHANGSNSGGGQGAQGDGVRPGDKSRRAFGGHKEKLDRIRNSLLQAHENGFDGETIKTQYHHQQPSPIPYDEVTQEGGLKVSQLSRLYQQQQQPKGPDSPDSSIRDSSSYASSTDSSSISNGSGFRSIPTGYGLKRKSSYDDRGQPMIQSNPPGETLQHPSPYGQQTSRQQIYLASGGDNARSLSSVSSNNSFSDGRTSSIQQQQPQTAYTGRSYTSTMAHGDSLVTNAQAMPYVKAVAPAGDSRLQPQWNAMNYSGYSGHSRDSSGQIHITASRAPSSNLQSTNPNRSGAPMERTNLANRLHVGKNGDVIYQSYVNPNRDSSGYKSSLTMNRVPGAADTGYNQLTINPEDRTIKRQTVITISTTSSTTYSTGKTFTVSDPMSSHNPPPYPQGRTYNVQAATAAAQGQSIPQSNGYDLGQRHGTMTNATYAGQGTHVSSQLAVPRNPPTGLNAAYNGQGTNMSNHLNVQPSPTPTEQHRSCAHIMILPADNQPSIYSPDMISAMINKTQPPPSYEFSTQNRQTPNSIQTQAGHVGGPQQRGGTPTMTQSQYNTARLTPQNSQGPSNSSTVFKPIPSQMGGNVVQIQTQLPQHHQPQPAVVTISRLEPNNDLPGNSKPPPPYRPAATVQNVETKAKDLHLKVPVAAAVSSTAVPGPGYSSPPFLQSVSSTPVAKPVLQKAHGPDQPPPARGPSPDTISTQSTSTQSSSARSESPLVRPPSLISEISDGCDLESASSDSQPLEKSRIESPVPERRNKGRHKERYEPRVRVYRPEAYKFYMEQHVENILKSHRQRIKRRMQLEQEMQRVDLTPGDRDQMRRMLFQKESNYLRLKRAKMNKSMFKKIKTLGIGAFGEVALARKVDTNALYAVKKLRKLDVIQRNQAGHVKAERDILAEADNEWVVKLYYSFQDKENLYFVMDYIPGGDLMSLLIRLEIFEEDLARFYIAELVLAIESVHKMDFIHRDIKPDNILIDRDGHIKLTDFGLCTGFRWTHDSKYYQKPGHNRTDSMEPFDTMDRGKCGCSHHHFDAKEKEHDRASHDKRPLKTLERRKKREQERCKAHSLVGTPNYIAPEVLIRTGYTQLCDWWSVGVILYEMLVGQPPFHADSPAETQFKVINWKQYLHIPSQAKLSRDASDFIRRLCTGPEERLGKNGVLDIKSHPFFQTIDFDSNIRKMKAPYIPTVRHPTDTSNFDPVSPNKLGSNSSTDSWDSNPTEEENHRQQTDHAFFEFTFRRFFDDNGHPYPLPIDIDSPPGPGEMERSEGDGAAAQSSTDMQDMDYV
ncbi:serine/threonine-protein kinase LATS2-like isoform X2 [Lytechinus variegatus]|uniref:serine/threonine-protein kinase LATS2-like isoform X2 n=1 Tax=Lytechinus variegatus TaxID=7654 RepID=UPI001BB0E0DC|nr:serine/threonine-protein kinase LATS2-like isoform X2 [Lytechinus variegatus]